MKNDKNVEQQVDKTLNQFDYAEQLPPDPYFYTRVQARLKENGRQRSVFPAFMKPILLTALLAVNVGTAVWYLSGNKQNYQSDIRNELVEILADDLDLDDNQSHLLAIE